MTASHLDTQYFSYRAAKVITEVFAPVPSGLVVVAFVAVWLIEAYLASASKNVIAAAVFIALILVSITLTLARERAGRAR